MSTTLNGSKILYSISGTNDAWHFEIKEGSAPQNQIQICTNKTFKNENLFESTTNISDYEMDPFTETSMTTSEAPPTKPVLTCLYYSSDNATSSQDSLNTNQVSEKVFKTIFGRNATFISKEVLLIGLPDGRTFVSSIWPDNSISNLTLIVNLNQPVIDIRVIKEGLLIVCYGGKMCLCDKKQQIFYVQGPIKSLHYHRESLFYVVPCGIIKMTKFVKNSEGNLSVKIYNTSVKDAEKITFVKRENHRIVAYVTKNDDLKALPLDLMVENFTNVSVRTLLGDIQKHSDKTIVLKNELEFLKTSLHNLSLACWLTVKPTNKFGESVFLNIIHKSDRSFDLIVTLKHPHVLVTSSAFHLFCQLTGKNSDSHSFRICKSAKIDSSEIRCVINTRLALEKVPLILTCALVISPSYNFVKYGSLMESLFPTSFAIKTFEINEVTLLENITESLRYRSDANNLSNSLLDMAERRWTNKNAKKMIQNDAKFFTFTLLTSSLILKFSKQSFEKKDLVNLITSKSLIISTVDCEKYWYQDFPIDIEASVGERHSQLTLSSTSLRALVNLRRAMMEDFLTALKPVDFEEMGTKNIALDLNNLLEIVKYELKILNKSTFDIDKLIEMYFEIRQRLSTSLPIF